MVSGSGGGLHTGWLVEMGQVGKVVAGLEHGGVHQWGQVGVIARLDGLERRLDRFRLQRGASVSMIASS